MNDSSALVVGGGVIGAACAYFLAKAGLNVTIVERDLFGHGCSHANCGLVCPSHVLPLAEPGAVKKSLKIMLRPNAPLKVGLRWDPALWQWLLRFAGCCRTDQMLRAARGRQALLHSSISLYRQLVREENLQCEWTERGLLFVYEHKREFEAFAQTNELLSSHFNESAVRYDGDALRELEPALKPGLAGGWYYKEDAHLKSEELLSSWRRLLENLNVRILEKQPVTDFVFNGRCLKRVETTRGELSADVFVLTTGAWTPLFSRRLKCSFPIQPGKGYTWTTSVPQPSPSIPLIFPEQRVAVTPYRSCFRLGSIMEFVGYDESIRPKRINLLKKAAARFLTTPHGSDEQKQWYGWRPMTYDGLPIIDRLPDCDNLWVAAGHNMIGTSTAPATGRLLAEQLTNAEPHISPDWFSFRRFNQKT